MMSPKNTYRLDISEQNYHIQESGIITYESDITIPLLIITIKKSGNVIQTIPRTHICHVKMYCNKAMITLKKMYTLNFHVRCSIANKHSQ